MPVTPDVPTPPYDESQFPSERERADKLQAFKDFVHYRLTQAGVTENPNGPHTAEGCRVGDRLDELIAERDKLREAARAAYRHLSQYGSVTIPGQTELASQSAVFDMLRPLLK